MRNWPVFRWVSREKARLIEGGLADDFEHFFDVFGFSLMNSSSLMQRPASTSKEEQITPPLLQELSLMMSTPRFSRARRAPAVR